ncbi:MAG: stage V sporulation protein AD [Clostridiaceae bacterium]|jgi:stage V sporulation protein AD|nr:stage V sporulation protein AD [Clostridiaceae bacterium]
MGTRLGKQTIRLDSRPVIQAWAAIVGAKEGQGPLRRYFDEVVEDEYYGEKSFEKAESKFIRETISKILMKGNVSTGDIQYLFAGDLLNQCTATSFGVSASEIPYFGLYGACSTIAESISLGSMVVEGGMAERVICITSSHFCSAEKQFRYPLEFGNQRPPTSQWTVTGSGGVLIGSAGDGPRIVHITTGKIVDMGITDANDMGAAMAPAAVDTITAHFTETGLPDDYYDMVVTGDLGEHGKNLCIKLLEENGINIKHCYNDCGTMIYSPEQGTDCGGSGCACSATVFAGYLLEKLSRREINRLLLVATGALHSPTSIQQGESIPAIAHAVGVEMQQN